MTPIVFCASLLPWLKAMNAADRTCSRRKRSFIVLRVRALEDVEDDHHQREADAKPMIGELTSGTITFQRCQRPARPPKPTAGVPPPTGRRSAHGCWSTGCRSRQVSRFQTIAADQGRGDHRLPSACGVTRPWPIVLATAVPVSAPTKLAAALMAIARGGSARVRPRWRSRWPCRGSR